MNLSMDQHCELTRISSYFEKIEELAERMGLEVDGLIDGLMLNNTSASGNLRKNFEIMAARRKHIFKNFGFSEDRDVTSIANLKVIVNENRF